MSSENMKVAVRVRAFNPRELSLVNRQCIIEMSGNQTVLLPPPASADGKASRLVAKTYAYDYSYWSFDGYVTEPNGYLAPAAGSRYCDQRRLYDDLGTDVLANAWNGYNACIFAYGQTSSGMN